MFENCDYLSILLFYTKKSTTTTRSYSFMQFYFYLFFASSALTYALNSVINSRLNVGHGLQTLGKYADKNIHSYLSSIHCETTKEWKKASGSKQVMVLVSMGYHHLSCPRTCCCCPIMGITSHIDNDLMQDRGIH